MEFLSCTVCTLPFDSKDKKPMTLSCGHSFCAKCIQSFSSCPTCRASFNKGNEKPNYTLIALVEQITDKINVSILKKVQHCNTHKREIDRFCKQCCILMCSVCQCPHATSSYEIISDINLQI